MKTSLLTLAALAAITVAGQARAASYYKTITVDGDVSDWAGIAPAFTDATGDGTFNSAASGTVDFTNVYVANDANYLYFRVQLAQAANPTNYASNYFINSDGKGNTGYGQIGAELLITDATAYQVASGAYTDGPLSAANAQVTVGNYSAVGTDGYEFRIARSTTLQYGAYANQAAFTGESITLEAESNKPDFNPGDEAYPIAYTFALAPEPATLSAIAASIGALALRRRRRA